MVAYKVQSVISRIRFERPDPLCRLVFEVGELKFGMVTQKTQLYQWPNRRPVLKGSTIGLCGADPLLVCDFEDRN